ncbi:RHS repeat domain-containing protein [Prevotella jejuni]|uniref:RHS repeat domain-containing protein n=1 Tax=Prevotella jejuni TaxID=1177574 RepID=UPI003211AF8F
MYDDNGNIVWQADYDIYGNVRNLHGSRKFIPFRQLGQYEDEETGLYYNRFRYYDPNTGSYISQDPIGLAGNNPTLYAFVKKLNTEVDIFGLSATHGHHSDPKFMGGDPKQVLTNMESTDHIDLHRDMNVFLESKTKVINEETVSMRPKRGNSGKVIRQNFTRQERLDVLAKFYLQNTDKYPEASADFFSQHPQLQKKSCKS